MFKRSSKIDGSTCPGHCQYCGRLLPANALKKNSGSVCCIDFEECMSYQVNNYREPISKSIHCDDFIRDIYADCRDRDYDYDSSTDIDDNDSRCIERQPRLPWIILAVAVFAIFHAYHTEKRAQEALDDATAQYEYATSQANEAKQAYEDAVSELEDAVSRLEDAGL